MVQLDAKKENGNIIITEDSFDHLLNCLDNQKFIPEYDKQTEDHKTMFQDYIDDFNIQCRNLLHNGGYYPIANQLKLFEDESDKAFDALFDAVQKEL